MPSVMHEGILQPFADRPALAAELLVDALGVKLPADWRARVVSGELTQLVPTQYLADLVVVASGTEGPALAMVLEVQLDRDDRKRYSWPVYLANLRAKLHCPTVLLAISPRPATALWCADPIELGPGSVVTPLVLGPDQLPLVTDPAAARATPELAVLSALTHGGDHPQRHQVLTAFCPRFGPWRESIRSGPRSTMTLSARRCRRRRDFPGEADDRPQDLPVQVGVGTAPHQPRPGRG